MTEIAIPHILRSQVLDQSDPHYGGIVEPSKGFPDPMSTRGYLETLLSLYYCDKSRYYRDPLMLERSLLCMEHLIHWQHEDGTIDFLEVDFFSVPTLAFSVQVLVPLVRVIDKFGGKSEAENKLRAMLIRFLERAAYAMPRGGFNTPNHRWVVASAESLCGNLLGSKACLDDCALYLNEGIDCDDEGEFTERSVGIYDAVNDSAMIIMADELSRPDLLTFVRRNLDKVQRYMEPDGTVMTLNSRRQDVGKAVYPRSMYWIYRTMAARDHNARYAWMSDRLLEVWEDTAQPLGNAMERYEAVGLAHTLFRFLLDERMDADLSAQPWENRYHEHYPKAGIVRDRQEDCSFTLIKDKPVFLKAQTGRLTVYAKLHACLTGFGEGRFQADELTALPGGGYRMTHKATLPYARPLKDPGTPLYEFMPNHLREKVGHQTLRFTVDALMKDRAVELSIDLSGVEGVPWKLELMFDGGGLWETNESWTAGTPGSWSVLKRGDGAYEKAGERFRVIGGHGEHRYAPFARTSEPPDAGKYTVFLTGFAPIQHTVRIEC